ncbi:MAG: methyltransferase domain-containing protein [Bacteroidota bacterium]
MLTKDRSYHTRLSAAWVRGQLAEQFPEDPLFSKNLSDLTLVEQNDLVRIGKQREDLDTEFLKMPPMNEAIKEILQILLAVQPDHLADLSADEQRTGFLWHLVNTLPFLPVTSLEVSNQWRPHIEALMRGGVRQIKVQETDPLKMANLRGNQFDVVTCVQALTLVQDLKSAFGELVRIAKRYILISLPKTISRAEIEELKEDMSLMQFKVTNLEDAWVIMARK